MDKILEILHDDARTSAGQIAKRLARSTAEVEKSIAQLEKDKVILGYRAILNPEKAEEGLVIGLIEVKLTPERGTGFDAIAQRIYRFPEVKVCYLISGGYDLHVVVEGKSLQEVATFVAERLATINHVASTSSHFILRKYKDFGVVLREIEGDERLSVSP